MVYMYVVSFLRRDLFIIWILQLVFIGIFFQISTETLQTALLNRKWRNLILHLRYLNVIKHFLIIVFVVFGTNHELLQVRASIEGQFLSMRAHAERFGMPSPPNRIIATGGASANDSILSSIASIFGCNVYTVQRPGQ